MLRNKLSPEPRDGELLLRRLSDRGVLPDEHEPMLRYGGATLLWLSSTCTWRPVLPYEQARMLPEKFRLLPEVAASLFSEP